MPRGKTCASVNGVRPHGSLVGESIRLGKTRPAIDAQLAATALVNGMVLVTRNEKDFEHTGVQVLNPFAKRS